MWNHVPGNSRVKVKNSVTGKIEDVWPGKVQLHYRVADARLDRHAHWQRSWREAIRSWMSWQPKRIGRYQVFHQSTAPYSGTPMWSIAHINDSGELWRGLRNRRQLAKVIRKDHNRRRREVARCLPDPKSPDTLGWRCFLSVPEIKQLLSPQQPAVRRTPELRVAKWDSSEVVRGNAGIHACLMPRRANIAHHPALFHYTRSITPAAVIGW